jgi:rhamnosyltransferase
VSSPARGDTVAAVIVAYNPDAAAFGEVLRVVAPQVDSIVVVDNGSVAPQEPVVRSLGAMASFIGLPRNAGLAAAQNVGVEAALAAAPGYVLLLDDDSTPTGDMVAGLRRALEAAAGRGERVAAAGPSYVEERSGAHGRFLRFGRLGASRVECGAAGDVLRADALISSGMLIPVAALREVGLMDASLFIDHVDTDWCLRARAKGLSLLGVCGAKMTHRLGDRPSVSIAGRRMFFRSPARHYYIFRNSVLLYRRPQAPLSWSIGDALRLAAMLATIALFCAPRGEHLRSALRGLLDGLRGRSGPLAGA